jgi:hypothetical protein
MQKGFSYRVLFFAVLFSGCTEKKSQTTQPVKTKPKSAQTFFPVTEYIRGQLSEIDSLPVTPVKIIIQNGKQDSIWMKKENIRDFAKPFLYPEIDSANLKDLFTEKSFLDQTINAYTISYDPVDELPDTLQLRRWDVYIDPKKNKIQRIYIIKEVKKNDLLQIVQLTWKSDQWCKITTITERSGRASDVKEEMMKWNFNE